MTTRYTQKHTHISHARSSDPELYYKIIFFTLFGHTIRDVSILTDGIPVQTIARNFKVIRSKLARNQNYLTEVFNRYFHADPLTGLYHGKWVRELRTLQAQENKPLTIEQKDRTERLVECLKDCPMGRSPKKFIQDYITIGTYNSDVKEITTAFDPINRPHPLSMPILQDIDGYMAFIKKKKSCKACRLCKRDRQVYFEIFSESQYTYIDIAYHLSRFQPKNIDDYNDHLYYAWINGSMRGIHHMKANKTALREFSFKEQLHISNNILLDFVEITYDALAGKFLPSFPLPD
jgi:hypothetical protein